MILFTINNLVQFTRRLRISIELYNSTFIVFLGPDCSSTSGIPTLSKLTERWLRMLRYIEVGNTIGYKEWQKINYPDYDLNRSSSILLEIMDKLFVNKIEKSIEREKIANCKEPSTGYFVLAKLLLSYMYRKFFIVLTNTFDDLLLNAIEKQNFDNNNFFTDNSETPKNIPPIFRIYGEVSLYSVTAGERVTAHNKIVNIIRNSHKHAGLIFLGYEGNDGLIFDLLNKFPQNFFNRGVYWVNSEQPCNLEMKNWLEDREAYWVKHSNFEDLMLSIEGEFELASNLNSFDSENDIFKKYQGIVSVLE